MSREHEKGPAQKAIRYEVRRERRHAKPIEVEEFLGLDRARVVALGYALDGPSDAPSFYSGRIQVVKVIRCQSVAGRTFSETIIDDLDEAGVAVFLNAAELPKAR